MDMNDPVFLTVKRLVTFVIGALIVGLNSRFLHLDDTTVASFTALVIGYLAQSAYKEVNVARAAAVAAAAKVTTLDQAVADLNRGPAEAVPVKK